MFKEFKEFAFRGNMLDLAIGIIIGGAFGAVVSSFAQDVLMSVVAAAFGEPTFDNLTFAVGRGEILYGKFLTAVVAFLLVAFALFFVVKAINRAMGPTDAPPEPPSRRECPYCTTSIPVVATRCLACTSAVEPVAT